MAVNTYDDLREDYDSDSYGYLLRFCDWNEKWSRSHFPDCHIKDAGCWEVILFLRNYYKQKKHPPTQGELCDEDIVDINIITKIFPYEHQNRDEGWYEYVCRIAGLPRNTTGV
ncbi:MAG: TusE/DsrC/DsvC family sulfur relay protein [Candidatus Moraniibacteriota bacterium]|jgi:sulfur relay (sulfurtransferase) DsrC/TusE family protein